MNRSMSSRIDLLVRRDRILAISFTILMWTSLIFVFLVSSAIAPNASVSVVLALSFMLLGAFNTASILAMVRVYSTNRGLIYRPDIINLDRNRRERSRESW